MTKPLQSGLRRFSMLVSTVFLMLTSLSALPQVPTPTPEQLEMLKTLPADQRDALMNQVLGGRGKGVDKQDPKLTFPQTVLPRDAKEDERKIDELTGEPRLRGEDTLILKLRIREQSGPDAPVLSAAQRMRQAQMAQQGQQQGGAGQQTTPPPVENQGLPAETGRPIERTPEEHKQLEDLRDRIERRNPYRLDKFGMLHVPELNPVALAGLTVDEARQRLLVEAPFKNFRVELMLLPLDRVGDDALKPFGYDLFAGVPTTFAPATDVPVPSDYVVGAGDKIDVQLFGNTNKSYSLTVGRDGQINFPDLGPIGVGGQRFTDVRRSLEERIGSQMIGVRASVNMGDTRSIRVFVLGEAERPGSYTVSGLSTITNALFASGGVKTIGSLRDIQLKRNGEIIGRLDLYDLLLNGDTSGDKRLLPGDVIFIPPVGATVTATGEVRRPAIYELKGESTAKDLLYLAGGLTPNADPRVAKLERIDTQRRRVALDLDLTAIADRNAQLSTGDIMRVQGIRSTLENSITVQGYVHRPSTFQYRDGMRLTDVLGSFDDLKPQADTHYILIRRELPPDGKIDVVSADLAAALAARGSDKDLKLLPKDRITVFDLQTSRDRIVAPLIDELGLQSNLNQPLQAVGIGGRIRAPGQYPLEEGMQISDLIRAGGGLQDAAYGATAELARYSVRDGDRRQTELIEIDLTAILSGNAAADIALKPYDLLTIKELPQWRDNEEIELLGEVRFPGKYPIRRGETLRSVIMRAGGLTDLAFPEGSVFLRQDLMKREQQQIESLARRMQTDITVLALQATQSTNAQSSQALAVGQSLLTELRNTKAVGRLVIDLNKIIAGRKGSDLDVMLKSGDKLMIPKKAQEVTVMGEVQNTTSHLYQAGLTRDDYIGLSGGATQKADKKHIYVVRADGSVVTSGNRWFQRSGGQIKPGDSIIVPLDAERMRPLPLWTAVTQIVYNLAIAAAAVNSF